MRVLLTRPREDSAALADKLRAAGHDVISEPMLDIRPVPDASVDLDGVQALLFTSANGVRAFAAAETRRDLPVFAVGDATAAAARAAGFARVESAAGRVDDLAQLVQSRLSPADGTLVHVAGRDVAGDLGGALGQAGFAVRRVVLYVAEAARSLSSQTARAFQAGEIDAVLFYSPRSAQTFRRLVEDSGLAASLRHTAALALSPAALEPARSLPWARSAAAPRPDEGELLQLIAARTPEAPSSSSAPPPKPEARGPARWLLGGSRAKQQSVPGSGRFLVPLVWLAVLLSLGTFFLQATQSNAPVPELSPAASLRLTTLERRVDALARAESSKSTPDPQFATRLKALSDRVDTLAAQSAPATSAGDVAALGQRVDELAARLADTEKKLAGAALAGEQLAALTAETKHLSDQVADLDKRLGALEAARKRNAAQAGVLLAAGQVAMAAARGGPLAPALSVLRPLAGDDARLGAAVAELQPLADRPVPTFDTLAARFPGVATTALRATQEARPAAASAATAAGRLEAWWRDIVRRLSAAVTIRRVGEVAGDSPDARIARAEQRLAAHDLAGAVNDLAGLPGEAAHAVAGWLDDARARLALDKAVGDLTAAAIAASASPS